MSDIVYIDFDDGVKRVMNNTKLYAKLLGKFKEDTSLDAVETALAAGDMEKARTSAHTLKGLAANLSLKELYNQTLELETQIKAGDVKADQLPTVKKIYAETMPEVDKVIAQYG
jgi:HPt (histidine-containing phosphotransfer) domain-containing protein